MKRLKANNKGALEMSVGTIVTIVLLMTVLVLGIYFIQKIFISGENAINVVDVQVQNEINQLFSKGDQKLSVYPSSRDITIKKGGDVLKGFAFSVYNNGNEEASFEYSLQPDDWSDCGETITEQKASGYIRGGSGTFSLGPSNYLENARLVRFNFDEDTPACTIFYNLDVKRDGSSYSSAQIVINIKA